MGAIEGFIKFLNTYPVWARILALAGLFTTAAVLVLAPRPTHYRRCPGSKEWIVDRYSATSACR
jgi:hypothetical protein